MNREDDSLNTLTKEDYFNKMRQRPISKNEDT